MPFPINSELVPINASYVTMSGDGIAVDWSNGDAATGWLVGELVVEENE